MENIITPTGVKKIILTKENFEEKIYIEDFADHSSVFDLEVRVQGKNSSVEIIGRIESTKENKKTWKISLVLEGENQSGRLDLKGVCDEKGFLEFDGGGVIGRNSSNGKMAIEEKILLFSKNSSAKAIPVLRVETEDVQSASHSANISPFDEEIFFYLQSRGIGTDEGKILLKDGMLKQ